MITCGDAQRCVWRGGGGETDTLLSRIKVTGFTTRSYDDESMGKGVMIPLFSLNLQGLSRPHSFRPNCSKERAALIELYGRPHCRGPESKACAASAGFQCQALGCSQRLSY